MIIVIHGDDTISSRNYYFAQKQKYSDIKYLDGEKVTFDEFFQVTQNQTIFDNVNIFIENFFKNKSDDFKKIVSYINSLKNVNLVFYESSEISKTNLTAIKNAQIESFFIPKLMFVFLDSLMPKNTSKMLSLYNSLRKQVADEIIYFMLIRQFRLLIGLNSNIDEVKRLAPWQTSKLQKQALSFSNLKKTYGKLFETDLNIKTGRLPFSYKSSIDFLLSDL